MNNSNLKVAIVHDWLVGGGAERVVYELHQMYPDAPIYTSYCTDEWRRKLNNKVVTGWLQYWPFSQLRKYIPFLRILWFSSLKFDGYDLVISSSGAEAKGIKVKKPAIHINYCHAPTHYYWVRYDEYLKNPGFGRFNWLARVGLKLLVGPMRRWDYKAAQRPDVMIANSNFTKDNIKKYYGRDSVVIHPPVDVERFKLGAQTKRSGFVTAGRQTPYKRTDLAVAACTALNLPLTVIGDGPDHAKLIKMAGPTITFLSDVADKDIVSYFQSAEAFIFPGMEDFGIVAVEAMAAGTPVIAYRGGGALDYVIPDKTGEFFEQQTIASLSETLKNFVPATFDQIQIHQKAAEFSMLHFRESLQAFIRKSTNL